jgi:GT2 family glycosyltransferase
MISIVTAYFNRKPQFYKTLKSIANSSVKDIELIVVDDCSSEEHRLEDLVVEFPFLKIIRLEKENKWYVNPCIPYNIGFKEAKGDIIIIQNPECYHIDDILYYVKLNLKENDYFSFSCYSLTQENTENVSYLVKSNFKNSGITHDGGDGWYNHSIYRPVGYHFCSAIHKSQLDDLGGFDERYAEGIAFDDNELLVRIQKKRMNYKIIDEATALHQWHYSSNNYQNVNASLLIEKNRRLLYDVTMKESGWKVNENKGVLPNVPKVMNFYWDGSKMSYLQYLTVVSFHKFNPDWTINIYEPTSRYINKTWFTNEQKYDYIGEDYYPKLKNLGYVNIIPFDFKEIGVNENISEVFKSDILRWYLLDNFGGGWSDMDILYIKPIDQLKLEGTLLTGTLNEIDSVIVFDGFHHIIGFYLTKPKTGLFSTIFEQSKLRLNINEYQSVGSRLLMRMYPTTSELIKKHPNLKVCNLPMEVVYPYNDSKINQMFNSTDMSLITDRTIGLHWYNGSEISKKFNNTYDPKNKNIDNILTMLIDNVVLN